MKTEKTATTITLLPTVAKEEISANDIAGVLNAADEKLETLFVKQLKIDEQGVAALASHEKACAIKSLSLNMLQGDWDKALQMLAGESSGLINLEELLLSGGGDAGPGFTALLSSTRLAKLHSLTTCMSAKGAAGVCAATPSEARLTSLKITSYFAMKDFRQQGAEALAKSPCLSKLKKLSIGALHSIYEEGAKAIAGSAIFSQLQELEINDDLIRDEGAIAIAGSPNLTKLRTLVLSANAIGEQGAVAIAGSSSFAALEMLDLSGNPIKTRGAEAIASSATLANLQQLKLSKTEIYSTGAGYLAKSAYLQNLIALDLRGNEILEEEEVWYDQGFPVGSTPATKEAKWLRQRFGDKVRL
jgi:Ran GTPase-activating protein (RanGAP) involved in mRNA processing and transport